MIHLFGKNIDSNYRISRSLSAVYGIGKHRINEICSYLGIQDSNKLHELSDAQISKMCRFVEQHYLVESELRKNQTYAIKRLLDIKSYRGMRHAFGLPLRGQRTHTNSRTQKALSKRRHVKTV